MLANSCPNFNLFLSHQISTIKMRIFHIILGEKKKKKQFSIQQCLQQRKEKKRKKCRLDDTK